MSSMFKKKGGLAFKPKAPVARPRPGASAPTTKTAPPPQPTIDENSEALPETVPEVIEKEPETHEIPQEVPETAVQEPTKESEKESLVEPSRRTTRRASQLESSSRPQIQKETPAASGTTSTTVPATEPPKADTPSQSAPSARTRRQSAAKPPPRTSIETPEQSTSSEEGGAARATAPARETQSSSATASEEPTSASRTTTRTRARRPSTAPADATTSAPEGEPSRSKKRQRKAPRQQDGTEAPAPRKRKTGTPNAIRSRSSSRRARSLTPEDAEDQVVDLQKLKMSDLTRDLRIGKKFSRHDELRERERKARLKSKLDKDGDTPSEAGVDGTQSPAPGSTDGTTTKANTGPQFRIVDGQIIVDQSSLVMDRHARAAAARANEDMETIEENDFTRLITSSSFMNTSKLRGPNVWTDPETELFYRGLRMFGTEFEMISKMFPGKQRRHVKLKFNREERHNPKLIDAALTGEKTIKMDIDEYRAFTGAEYESLESIEAEHRKIQETYEAERQRVADEQAEIMRKKKEELFADEDGEDGGLKKKGKGKKKGKKTVQYGLNGEPITED
ncbi:transcription factor tfiiib component [Metarhizium acridum CQMa 102]|uniref:Transcription factor tfiiib component n=1 Tax=Metarhizium acridum (strain CQMa 102) TaxID=655827 RepID=E9E1F2_METAQ|nr:transcription factor tfiiib component [Metarhizium acridum CQMa 102]EFY90185.1 transcription factor tfiiib component [Metarhizium acridum CQMa 102]